MKSKAKRKKTTDDVLSIVKNYGAVILLFLVGLISLSLFLFVIYEGQDNPINVEKQKEISNSLSGLTDDDRISFRYSTNENNYKAELDVARSNRKKAIGLMNAKELEEGEGMIFIFDNEEPLTFWMKDTLIPLDIIFLSSDFEIIKVHKNTLPNQTEEVYPSILSAKYVIEMNASDAERFGLKEGEQIDIDSVSVI